MYVKLIQCMLNSTTREYKRKWPTKTYSIKTENLFFYFYGIQKFELIHVFSKIMRLSIYSDRLNPVLLTTKLTRILIKS